MGSSNVTATVVSSVTTAQTEELSITVMFVSESQDDALLLMQMFETEENIAFRYCPDPSKASQMAKKNDAHVILLDLGMQNADGLSVARYVRAIPEIKDIPLIAVSQNANSSLKIQAFSSGACDFLIKFPEKLELIARIKYYAKGYIALQQRNLAYEALTNELSEAAEYVKRLIPAPRTQYPQTDWQYIPSTLLGGDSFGYHWIDDDHFAIYLLDVCGHGVGAALLGVSIINVLRTQALRDTEFKDPSMVLTQLNNNFQMEEHNNMFFTIWYGVFNRNTRMLTYSSGGHPPAALLCGDTPQNTRLQKLTTSNFIVGAMPGSTYQNAQCQVPAFGSLFLYSDGVYEIKQFHDGKMWSLADWMGYLEKFGSKTKKLKEILAYIRVLQGTNSFDDDFSLLRIML